MNQKRKTMFSEIREQFDAKEERMALNNRIALGVLGLMINEYCFPNSLKRMKAVLRDPIYKESLESLDTNYMPAHWKFFYYCAKKQWSCPIELMIWLIQKIRK